MGAIGRWSSTARPYARTALLLVGFGLSVLAATLLNWLLWFSREGVSATAGEPPMHGAVGVGMGMTVLTLGALLLAGGFVCLGGAIPAGDNRPGLALPAGTFDETQRSLLASAGVVMLGAMVGMPLLGALVFVLLPPLGFALLMFGLPLAGIFGYLLVLAAATVPLDSRERAPSWLLSLAVACALVLLAGIGVTRMVEADLYALEMLAAGLPAVTVVAGYVARTSVVTYFSRD